MEDVHYVQFTDNKLTWSKDEFFRFFPAGGFIDTTHDGLMSFRLTLIRE